MPGLIVSPTGRRYGRFTPPAMPKHRMLKRAAPPTFPPYVDLRKFSGPVKDQGDEGSCTGHAFSSSIEWICRAYPFDLCLPTGAQPVLSPQYFYAHELIMDGDFPQDNGSDGETGSKVAIQFGCCEASFYPYKAGDIEQPTPAQDANAKKYSMGAYHGVSDSQTVISILGDPVPWPVEIGFDVYESFESDTTAQTGVMPIPNPNAEQLLGGHEVCGCGGYDIGASPTIRPAGCPPAILIQNSWGTGWGISGFFWMPLQVLDQSSTDIKIVHAGRPW